MVVVGVVQVDGPIEPARNVRADVGKLFGVSSLGVGYNGCSSSEVGRFLHKVLVLAVALQMQVLPVGAANLAHRSGV